MKNIPIVEDPEILRRGHAVEIAFCLAMSKNSINRDGIIAVTINLPDPILNLVIDAQLNEKNVHQGIELALQFFKEQQVSWTWQVGPASKPANLASHLERHGLSLLDSFPSMFLDLDRLKHPEELDEGISIREVLPGEDLNEWIEPVREGFPSSDNAEGFLAHCSALPYGRQDGFHHYVVRVRNQVVASGTCYIDREGALIHNLATKVQFRKRGYASALTFHIMRQVKKSGVRYCFLDSSREGIGLYSKLGFKAYCINHLYGFK